jgi:uncharacterized protein
MNKAMLFVTVLILTVGPVWAQTTDLFISEYIEGNSNNKALEIFNGTSDDIDLGPYSLTIYSNGSSTPGQTIAFDSASIPAGGTLVLVNSFAAPDLLAFANQTSNNLTFNGDDAVLLEKSGQVVDCIGTVGVDPGYFWSCDDGNTQNQTLRRKTDVCAGDTDSSDTFDVCQEWVFFAVDTFDGLNQHTNDCGSVGNKTNRWGTLKAIYR